MKKTLIALAALGAAVSVHATNVTVYGVADIGYVDGPDADVSMGEKVNNRLGVKGSEDLGNGLKAIFQLEQRFNLADGASSSRGDFEGAANVGLAGDFGMVRFGRLNELSTETVRKLDPFNQYGVAGAFTTYLRGNEGSGRLDSTVRWDSPEMSGVQLGVSYTLATADAGLNSPDGEDGFALSGTYTNDALYAVANYNKSANADVDNWNIGASYDFDGVKISALYEDSDIGTVAETHWLLGVSWKVGNGVINASYNKSDLSTSNNGDFSGDKWALGYQYNLSKQTSIYADIATLDGYHEIPTEPYYDYEGTSINIGMTHKF